MHGDGWFPWFGLGHWGLGLLVWIVIVILLVGVVKSLFSGKDE